VARLWQPVPIRRPLEVSEIAARLHQAVQIASASRPAARLVPLLPVAVALTLVTGPSAVRLARLTVPSLTARRSLTTRFRV
jgi:hypothetical protein